MSESVQFVDLNFSNGKEISGFDHSLDELCDSGISGSAQTEDEAEIGSIQTENEADTGSISKKEGMGMKQKRKSQSKLISETSEEPEKKRMNIKREPRVS